MDETAKMLPRSQLFSEVIIEAHSEGPQLSVSRRRADTYETRCQINVVALDLVFKIGYVACNLQAWITAR